MKRELIPRPLRACLWALVAILLAITYYIALGCPTLSIRQEFRRAEKANLVGPSNIVDRVSMPQYSEFETMLVGETDHGIIFFGKYGTTRSGNKFSGDRYYRFSYQEKSGDVTFAAAPNIFGYTGLYSLPVYVFTEHEDAVSATIRITTGGSRSYTVNGQKVTDPFHVTFHGEAQRDQNGFFRFDLTAESLHNPTGTFGRDNDQAYALFCLSNLCNDTYYYDNQRTMVIPIRVTLFDADGNEILTKELQLGPYEQPKPDK